MFSICMCRLIHIFQKCIFIFCHEVANIPLCRELESDGKAEVRGRREKKENTGRYKITSSGIDLLIGI